MTRSRALAAALVLGMLGLGMLGPVATGKAAAASGTVAPGCDVTDATLEWGFKESFRAYIDGDIANGEWTTTGDASYETPVFTWSGGTGRYDSDLGSGVVRFSGSVRFTGHDGLLDTTIADPVVSLAGDTATLIVDVSGPSMEGDQIEAVDVPFVELVDLELAGEDALVTIDAATVLTDEGEAAFPDYQAGTDFDPVVLVMHTSGECAAGVDGGDAGVAGDPQPHPLTMALIVALAVGGSLLALAAIVALAVVLVRRRRRA